MSGTIVAIATAVGESGIGVVRVSGEKSLEIAQKIFRSQKDLAQNISALVFGSVIDPKTSQKIDTGLACYFKAPHSYTGEDVVEFQLHGSPLILQTTVMLCLQQDAIPAQPGEFTQRAFLNGKLDLSQAEAVIETIQAKTENQRHNAAQILNGELKKKIQCIDEIFSTQLIKIEATLDYPEEMEPFSMIELERSFSDGISQIQNLLQTASSGRILREAIVGKPNVGKSSLFNHLLSEDRSIVTHIAGTTRDVVHEEIVWRGNLLRLMDTAGLRKTADHVEQLGIERSQKEISHAHIVLHLVDHLDEVVPQIPNQVVLLNKIDQLAESDLKKIPANWIPVSVKNNLGFEKLEQALTQVIQKILPQQTQDQDFAINQRHQNSLLKALEHAQLALQGLQNAQPLDMLTIDLRATVAALRQVTGESLSLDTINQIFAQFCVGK